MKNKHLIIYKYLFCLFLLIFARIQIKAQDSTYIDNFKQDFAIGISTYRNFTMLSQEIGDDYKVTYKPNNPVGINIALSWKGTTLSFGYGFDFMRSKDKGKTKSTDFQYHYYGRKVLFDFFFQCYKGFYLEEDDDNKIDLDQEIALHPDLNIKQYGLFGQYIFNGNKFSSSAAFNQNQLQKKSSGSFLLGGGIYYSRVTGDSTIVFSDNTNRTENFQFGISLGYSYSWIIKKRYFVSLSMSAGINLSSKNISSFTKDKLKIYPSIFPRVGAGYNGDDWSIGLSFIMNRVYIDYTKDSNMTLESGNFKLTYIKRIQSIPIVSKLFGNEKPKFLSF